MVGEDSVASLDGLVLAAASVAERAAIAASRFIGRGDEKVADQAAVDAMREALNALAIRGRVVIGEGERDEAPMLYIGEEVGRGWAEGTGPEIDIALDPLEGTTLTAKAMPNALAVLAMAPRGGLLFAPDTYMDKIAVGPGYPDELVSFARSPAETVRALADAKGVAASEITVCVLDRERHAELIGELRGVGARVALISDGDVQAVVNVADPTTNVDLYLGSGGAPEGVLAAAALTCMGGQMKGRLVFRSADERERARKTGIADFDKVYSLRELVSAPAVFAATGVTNGSLLDGVRMSGGQVRTHTLVMNAATGVQRRLRSSRSLANRSA